MTPEKIAFKEARELYRTSLIKEINVLLSEVPNETEIKLVSNTSLNGIATGEYTDVVSTINGLGFGLVYSDTDLSSLAFDEKVDIIQTLPIQGLEDLKTSIENYLK